MRAMLSDALWRIMTRLTNLRDGIKGRTMQMVTTEVINRVDNSDAFETYVNDSRAQPTLMMLVSTAASDTESGHGTVVSHVQPTVMLTDRGVGAAAAHVQVDHATGMLVSTVGADVGTDVYVPVVACSPLCRHVHGLVCSIC